MLAQAMRLASSAASWNVEINQSGVEARLLAEVKATARTALDETAFAALWAEGEEMSLDEAVAYGLL